MLWQLKLSSEKKTTQMEPQAPLKPVAEKSCRAFCHSLHFTQVLMAALKLNALGRVAAAGISDSSILSFPRGSKHPVLEVSDSKKFRVRGSWNHAEPQLLGVHTKSLQLPSIVISLSSLGSTCEYWRVLPGPSWLGYRASLIDDWLLPGLEP